MLVPLGPTFARFVIGDANTFPLFITAMGFGVATGVVLLSLDPEAHPTRARVPDPRRRRRCVDVRRRVDGHVLAGRPRCVRPRLCARAPCTSWGSRSSRNTPTKSCVGGSSPRCSRSCACACCSHWSSDRSSPRCSTASPGRPPAPDNERAGGVDLRVRPGHPGRPDHAVVGGHHHHPRRGAGRAVDARVSCVRGSARASATRSRRITRPRPPVRTTRLESGRWKRSTTPADIRHGAPPPMAPVLHPTCRRRTPGRSPGLTTATVGRPRLPRPTTPRRNVRDQRSVRGVRGWRGVGEVHPGRVARRADRRGADPSTGWDRRRGDDPRDRPRRTRPPRRRPFRGAADGGGPGPPCHRADPTVTRRRPRRGVRSVHRVVGRLPGVTDAGSIRARSSGCPSGPWTGCEPDLVVLLTVSAAVADERTGGAAATASRRPERRSTSGSMPGSEPRRRPNLTAGSSSTVRVHGTTSRRESGRL